MNDPVVEFYKNVDMEDYLKKLYEIPPRLLMEEFLMVKSLYHENGIEFKRTLKLSDLVFNVILYKLQFADNKNKWASVDQYEIFLNQQLNILRRGEQK